jgi:broad specificity phosphatase PhoE
MNIKYFPLLILSLAIYSTSNSMELPENTTEIWLVRHGETTINKAGDRVGGRSDHAELTQNGIDQAHALGNYLKNHNLTFDYFYSSTAVRTKKTLECCFPSENYIASEELLELDQGDWEGRKRVDVYTEEVGVALKKANWTFIPGDLRKGESQEHVAQRMKAYITKLAKEHKGKLFIVSHGLAIKFFLACVCNYKDEETKLAAFKEAYKKPIDNTSVTIVLAHHNLDEISFSVIKENDTTHLKEANLSTVAGAFDDKK